MDNMMEKISKVLSDEETMKQLGELAKMIGIEQSPDSGSPALDIPVQQTAVPVQNFQTAQTSQASQTPNLAAALGGADLSKMASLAALMSSANKSNPNADLIMALRPLLKEENQVKADRAVKILKLIELLPVLRESGMLGGDFLGIL